MCFCTYKVEEADDKLIAKNWIEDYSEDKEENASDCIIKLES